MNIQLKFSEPYTVVAKVTLGYQYTDDTVPIGEIRAFPANQDNINNRFVNFGYFDYTTGEMSDPYETLDEALACAESTLRYLAEELLVDTLSKEPPAQPDHGK